MTPLRLHGSCRIVGAGLLGTSIGLALTKAGLDVIIEDSSPANARLAIDYGAGRSASSDDEPSLIVVCVPPDVTAAVVARELAAYPNAVVTDVASVKTPILQELKTLGADLSRYVGSHPMAGRERGGALAARADLFFSRPWVIATNESAEPRASMLVEALALDLGAIPSKMAPEAHDRAVALVSHAPQLVSTLMAARLAEAEGSDVSLAGQGLRDVTRIAASDPKLWVQILGANAPQVVTVLKAFASDLAELIEALEDTSVAGALATIASTLGQGNEGVAKIPGKHGSSATNYAVVVVMIDDKPGQLAKLLTEIGEVGINLEDLKLEHSPGAQIGLVELSVQPKVEASLVAALTERGWRLA